MSNVNVETKKPLAQDIERQREIRNYIDSKFCSIIQNKKAVLHNYKKVLKQDLEPKTFLHFENKCRWLYNEIKKIEKHLNRWYQRGRPINVEE